MLLFLFVHFNLSASNVISISYVNFVSNYATPKDAKTKCWQVHAAQAQHDNNYLEVDFCFVL